MLKMLSRMSIIFLLVVMGFTSSHRSQATSGVPFPASAAGAPTWVEVTFDGLLVFQKVGKHYEVGVVNNTDAPHHEFIITVGRKTKIPVPKSKSLSGTTVPLWNLVVVTMSGKIKDPNIKVRHKQDCDREKDTLQFETLSHVHDFCWIIDFQKDFPRTKEVKLRSTHLIPIITLSNGELFTKFKYDEMEREGGGGTFAPLGFVAETIGLRVKLDAGDHLELRIPEENTPLFSLPFAPPGEPLVYKASFLNAPIADRHIITDDPPSHFKYYYEAFDVGGEKFDVRTKENGLKPLNRLYPPGTENRISFTELDPIDDQIRDRSYDHQLCGTIFLGARKTSLSVGDTQH